MASGNESGSTLPEKENIYWDIRRLKFFLLLGFKAHFEAAEDLSLGVLKIR